MKKSALFLVVLIGILGNANVIATTNGYTTGAELTKADFDLIAGVIDQNGLFVATTIGTFSAGAAALCWLKGKWKGNEADVKNAAKKGASVGVGFATAVALMRNLNRSSEICTPTAYNLKMSGIIAGSALTTGLFCRFQEYHRSRAPQNNNLMIANQQRLNLKKIIYVGAGAALTAGILYGGRNSQIAEAIEKRISECSPFVSNLLSASAQTYSMFLGIEFLYEKPRVALGIIVPSVAIAAVLTYR